MKHTVLQWAALGICAVAWMVGPAIAADPIHLKTVAAWHAFGNKAKKASYCYAVSRPAQSEGKYTKRGDTFVTITHIRRDKSFDVVRFDAGYVYKDDTEVAVIIGDAAFALFTRGGYAWARDAGADKALVRAMRAGKTMVVHGVSKRGTKTMDTYSLSGISAAHNAINKACNAN